MNPTQDMIKKSIVLPRGEKLDVDITPQFLDIVCSHFNLLSPSLVNDEHIRIYIYGAFKNAIDKVELK